MSAALGSASLNVTEVGYETTPDTAVDFPGSDVPEPSSMALLLLGAAELSERRRAGEN